VTSTLSTLYGPLVISVDPTSGQTKRDNSELNENLAGKRREGRPGRKTKEQ
jgi:hypothetical protein